MNYQWCDEFYEAVKKHFGFLDHTYEFSRLDTRQAKGGEYCLIVLESRECRVKFDFVQGGVGCWLGTLNAPLTFDDVVNGRKEWYLVTALQSFLNRIPSPTVREFLEDAKRNVSWETRLSELADKVRDNFDELIGLFSPSSSTEWLEQFAQWKQNQAREFREQLAAEYEETARRRPQDDN